MSERITGHTELIGLMAYPIRHSSSPAMQNEAFAKLGYDYAYLAFEVGADEIEDAVKAIRTLKMRGSNVSIAVNRCKCNGRKQLQFFAARCSR